MLSPQLLARLGQLNRDQPLVAGGARPVVNRATIPSPVLPIEKPAAEVNESTSHLPAGVEVENARGRCYLIRQTVEELWRGGDARVARWRQQRATAEPPDEQTGHVELQALAANFSHGLVALDLETCGLAGCCVFLAGLLHETDDGLVLSQLLARDYSEEAAMLHALWEIVGGKQVLVTFNGKSFDWPCVSDRSTLHGVGPTALRRRDSRNETSLIEPASPPTHCDILHHARRRWKQHLPNCKLQTLERWICGRRRVGDIPGSEIPAVYHRFVRTGDAWELRRVLHHNALDLVTLLQLSMVLATARNPA
jgi:uncharacterized protein YprB with RNaseH-like and TPR domain